MQQLHELFLSVITNFISTQRNRKSNVHTDRRAYRCGENEREEKENTALSTIAHARLYNWKHEFIPNLDVIQTETFSQ